MSDYLHGVELVELDVGPRPIATSKSAVIGLVGTAQSGPVGTATLVAGSRKEASAIFGSPTENTTIPQALNAIFDQTGALVVVVNASKVNSRSNVTVPASGSSTATLEHNIINLSAKYVRDVIVRKALGDGQGSTLAGTTSTAATEATTIPATTSTTGPNSNQEPYVEGKDYSLDAANGIITLLSDNAKSATTFTIEYSTLNPTVSVSDISNAVEKLIGAESVVKVTPRLLIAPGFTGLTENSDSSKGRVVTHDEEAASKTLVDKLLGAAERLRAIAIIDGPNTDNNTAKSFAETKSNSRAYVVDPYVKVFDSVTQQEIVEPASARVAGVIAKSDHERGFWFSPSNRPILGITGTARPIDFSLGDSNAHANLLNEANVATIVHQNGYRLWGGRSTSADKKWAFISVRRTADLINDALLRSHLWAVDRNITKTYIEDVVAGVNSYLRSLKARGAILGGHCWADPELNTPDQIQQGKISFNFDFTPPYPAEHITFRSTMVNDYLLEIF